MTQLERDHHIINTSYMNGSTETEKTEADYTICDKMSVSEMYINTSIVEYLFEQGKCGEICKDGKKCLLQQDIFLITSLNH